MIDDPGLLRDLDGRMVYYENSDQRICIVFPWQGKVLAGSTEVPHADPDTAECTPEERRYILDSLAELFPGRTVDPDAIVSTFSGVRPLLADHRETSGEMSREHSCAEIQVPGSRVRVFSMTGGKWTTFRSFSAEMADIVLDVLGVGRTVSTEAVLIGGGRDYPNDAPAREAWLQQLSHTSGLTLARVEQLLERYGTRAVSIAESACGGGDEPLANCPSYSVPEIAWIIRNEKVRRLEDVVLRRTNLALLGQVSMPLLDELSHLCVTGQVFAPSDREQAVADTAELLRHRFAIRIT